MLGHVVSNDGIRVNPDKLVVILTLIAFTIVFGVNRFLGCVGYCHFIYCYARIALPFTKLLRRTKPFEWKPKRQCA